jgi:tRNA U34 2-thiouridine synthase MnmA/TrmU
MKAIALVSGGLDSILAARLVSKQGVNIIGLKFKTSFQSNAKKRPPDLGLEIKEIDIASEFLDLVLNPRYGYGSNINPCIDCKIFMLGKVKELMEEFNAKFIITGEVLGQRPMSQNRQALELIEKRSGLEGLLLRPLSAKLLKETIPEKEGWVDRKQLLNLSGRARKEQIKLAQTLGIKEYLQPAGGCLLTDPEFTKKMKKLIDYKELNLENIELLKMGRFFRLSETAKLVVGRDQKENERLTSVAEESDYLFMPQKIAGPTALGKGDFGDELIKLSCRVVCHYCDLDGENKVDIACRKPFEKKELTFKVEPVEENKLTSLKI